MRGIRGWRFPRYYSADGSDSQSTRDAISIEKKNLEARLAQIPSQIAAYEQSIVRMQQDYDWLSSLDKSRQKSYQKENGKHPHEVSAAIVVKINEANNAIGSLRQEKSRIPQRLEELQKQLDSLVRGESDGLAKGLDKESAKALGEIELQKEKARFAHEAKILDIETQKAEQLAQKELEQNQTEQTKGNNTKLIVGISVAVVLIIIGIIIYRKRMAKGIVQPMAA